jgi:hypothetical protein
VNTPVIAPLAVTAMTMRTIAWLWMVFGLVTASCAVQAQSSAFRMFVSNQDSYQGGPLTDVGHIRVVISAPDGQTHFGCQPTVSGFANRFRVTIIVYVGPPTRFPCDDSVGLADLGSLDAGTYELNATLLNDTGGVLTSFDSAFTVAVAPITCNTDPFTNQLYGPPVRTLFASPDNFLQRYQADSAFRALFGDMAYVRSSGDNVIMAFPPLSDGRREKARLIDSGQFARVDYNSPGCFATSPPNVIGTVVEYWNALLDHYFMTADGHEQAQIEAGAVGPGWVRTGETFKVIVRPGCAIATEGGFHPVYRFAGIPDVGPNSHFFTASEAECAVVRDRTEWHWQFEGAPFWVTEPSAQGTCPSRTRPVYRAYNNGMAVPPTIATLRAWGSSGRWSHRGGSVKERRCACSRSNTTRH